MTPHLLLDIVVPATNAQEAQTAARAWAAAEPKIRLVRITRVRPAERPAATPPGNEWVNKWAVEIVYSIVESDQLQAGL